MPDTSESEPSQRLRKADYDYLTRQASRGALLCEFLANPRTFTIEEHTRKRYEKELQGIEQAIIETVSVTQPA